MIDSYLSDDEDRVIRTYLMPADLKGIDFWVAFEQGSIAASGSNFNPQNTKCIPAVEIFAFLELDQN
ncbi:MAG: hypothetical protein JRH13_15885 [Deltaproteobacteria bacterium]|nr:hypothetical protein [Deltaproteobacteria bacterium]